MGLTPKLLAPWRATLILTQPQEYLSNSKALSPHGHRHTRQHKGLLLYHSKMGGGSIQSTVLTPSQLNQSPESLLSTSKGTALLDQPSALHWLSLARCPSHAETIFPEHVSVLCCRRSHVLRMTELESSSSAGRTREEQGNLAGVPSQI